MDWWREFLGALAYPEVFSELIVSMVLGAVVFLLTPVAGLVVRFASRLLGIEKPPEPESYSQRLTKLTQELTRASSEVDGLLAELAQVARDKENTVQELGSHLVELEQKEAQLQKRIEELEGIPSPAAVRRCMACWMRPPLWARMDTRPRRTQSRIIGAKGT